jgi:hypothetical protein
MNTLISMVEMEVRLNYVTSSWVAWYYGVSLSSVYQAADSGRLKAVVVPAAQRRVFLFDRRTLPNEWPGRMTEAEKTRRKVKRARERRQRQHLREAA